MTIYETIKNIIKRKNDGNFSSKQGSMAGICSKLFTSSLLYPFNLIRSRQQMIQKDAHVVSEDVVKKSIVAQKHYGFFLNSVKTIYKADGFSGFYKGLSPLLIRQIPSSSIFFYTYEHALKYFTNRFEL
jgi:solute carrier family 25 folate transporter 32